MIRECIRGCRGFPGVILLTNLAHAIKRMLVCLFVCFFFRRFQNLGHCFLHKVEITVVFILKNIVSYSLDF